jgi:dTDP-4-dehydrorhamnose 3,5-epimerase
MKFQETKLSGVFEISVQPHADERGFFARTWCAEEFAAHRLNPLLSQCSASRNKRKGTLRGMHYQNPPHQEAKLVRCTQGAIYDVVVDLRPESPTFKGWIAATLTADNHRMIYVPEGCGHGFLTLEDETEVFYQISAAYHPGSSRGVRWNDPTFQITWPAVVTMISERDASYPNFR